MEQKPSDLPFMFAHRSGGGTVWYVRLGKVGQFVRNNWKPIGFHAVITTSLSTVVGLTVAWHYEQKSNANQNQNSNSNSVVRNPNTTIIIGPTPADGNAPAPTIPPVPAPPIPPVPVQPAPAGATPSPPTPGPDPPATAPAGKQGGWWTWTRTR